MAEDIKRAFPSSIPYKVLQRTHEEYDCDYWNTLKAFYCGGKDLLKSQQFKNIFPPHLHEAHFIYSERVARAFYVNYAGEIIDHIVSALMMHPVQVKSEEDHDPFYDMFMEDVSYVGGKRTSLHQLIRKQVTTALICKQAWTLVDFPPIVEMSGEAIVSEGDQREVGQLNAYALCVDPESVLDWEETPDGELIWAKTCVLKKEKSFDGSDDEIVAEYTVYRPNDWARYAIKYKPDNPPKEDDPVGLIADGPHSFGRVPLIRLTLPDALWAMNKLESLSREHLNKRCALAWAEYKTLFQQLYEFEGEEPADSCSTTGVGEDAGRFTNQARGPGYVQIRASGDRAEFVGPSAEPFSHALNSLKDIRDEMHRITHQMALSYDNHALALRRSGDSKAQDKKDSTVVLNALGQLSREHVFEIFTTIAYGRQDDLTWVVGGLDEYDDVDITSELNQAILVNTVDIPSPAFKVKYKAALAKAVLGEKISAETLRLIEAEIAEAYKDEEPETAEQRAERKVEEGAQALGMGNQPAQGPSRDQAQREVLDGTREQEQRESE